MTGVTSSPPGDIDRHGTVQNPRLLARAQRLRDEQRRLATGDEQRLARELLALRSSETVYARLIRRQEAVFRNLEELLRLPRLRDDESIMALRDEILERLQALVENRDNLVRLILDFQDRWSRTKDHSASRSER